MRAYAPTDLPTLNAWRAGHGLGALSASMVSGTGFMVDGVAAGFLFRLGTSDVALLDGFVTAPRAPLRARRAALAALVERLTAEATAGGARSLVGLTNGRGMRRFVERLGFRDAGEYHLMAKGARS